MRNIPDYPDLELLHAEIRRLPRHVLVDAAALAEQAGSLQSTNLALLGAAAPFLGLPEAALEASLDAVFAGKSDRIRETNQRAFRLGVATAPA